MTAVALTAALAWPCLAQNTVRTVAPEAGGVTAVPAVSPNLSPTLSAPSLAAPNLTSPVLPAAVVPRTAQASAATAQAATARPVAAAAAPAPAAQASGVTERRAAGILGPDGRPLSAAEPAKAQGLIIPGAQSQGRNAAPSGPTAPNALDALFDGSKGLPLDLASDGLPLRKRIHLGAADPGTLETARAETRRAVAAAQGVAAEAASARTFQGRAMSLDDPCCGVAAPVMGVLLRRAGVPVDAVQAEFHTFLVREAAGGVMVVDPTIRQFFGGRRAPADVPQVFVGTLGELSALFQKHAAAKTTKYDVSRIYLSEAVVKNSLLAEAESLADASLKPGLRSPAEAVDDATYAPLKRALNRSGLAKPAGPANPAAEPARKAPADLKAAPAPANAAKPAEKGWLSSIKEFFFPTPAPDPAWDAVKAAFPEELGRLRALPKAERAAFLRAVGDEVTGRLKERFGTQEIGFHYNLHGGQAEDYVKGGGIRATMGDIALNYSMNGDRNYKVYFFRSSGVNLYDVLNERHPNLVSSRMGNVLILFRLDSQYLKDAFASGLARNPTAIFIDFDETRLPRMVGIPKETFLGPPLTVFTSVARRMGQGSLSRDEETLAVMRYLDAALGVPNKNIE